MSEGLIDTCYVGDVRDGLRAFIAAGVRARTCVTSPPYWGLRDYGVPEQLGLESSPGAYIAAMVDVFRLVRDVLTDDGTLWLNMGDSYAGSRCGGMTGNSTLEGNRKSQDEAKAGRRAMTASARRDDAPVPRSDVAVTGLKPKDLVGMPWRLAFALQADGWYLRQDIIWHKPNPMPESIRDRCTKAHEYLFLLSKREKYFYDFDAMKEPASEDTHARYARGRDGDYDPPGQGKHGGSCVSTRKKVPSGWDQNGVGHRDLAGRYENAPPAPANGVGFGHGYDKVRKPRVKDNESFSAAMRHMPLGRNKRSVWTIPTEAFKGAHFATFPRMLVRPCVLAGSAVGDVVVDPFLGSGTTAKVALELGRHWIGCELNPDYAAMHAKRTAQHGLALHAT